MTDDAPTYQREHVRDWSVTHDKKCCGTCAWSRTIEIKPFRVGCVEPTVSTDGVPVPIITARTSGFGKCGPARLWTAKKS